MKNRVPVFFAVALLLVACEKKNTMSPIEVENQRIDSLNIERQKLNEQIEARNKQNQFPQLNSEATLSFQSDEANFKGPIKLENVGRDRYKVSGIITQGKQSLKITGELQKVSAKYINFEGEISQTFPNSSYLRNKKMTFAKEGKQNYYRLQDKVGGQGFVEYIDIHF
ncbi:hypothetical protein [Chryseobacterium sp. A321]